MAAIDLVITMWRWIWEHTPKITGWLVAGTFIVWVLWDIIPVLRPERGDSISEIVRKVGLDHPAAVFALMFVMGHFFMRANPGAIARLDWAKANIEIVAALGFLCGGWLWLQR